MSSERSQASSAATTPLRSAGPIVLGVACSQWASCGWRGRRVVHRLGIQPKPCPKCGKEVVA